MGFTRSSIRGVIKKSDNHLISRWNSLLQFGFYIDKCSEVFYYQLYSFFSTDNHNNFFRNKMI